MLRPTRTEHHGVNTWDRTYWFKTPRLHNIIKTTSLGNLKPYEKVLSTLTTLTRDDIFATQQLGNIHLQQTSTYIHFCDHYSLPLLNPSIPTITCYITYLIQHFKSARSVCNYISGIRFLHKELGLAPVSLDSFPVILLLRAADITMRLPPSIVSQFFLLSSSTIANSPPAWVPWGLPCGWP